MEFNDYCPQQKALFFAVGSVCLPFPLTCITLIAVFFFLVFSKKEQGDFLKVKSELLIIGFGALITVVPLFYKRYLSAVAGAAILLGIFLFLYLKKYVTSAFFKNVMELCCLTSFVCFFVAIVQKIIKGPGFRATGGLFNANYYGTICEFIIIFSVFFIITQRRFRAFHIFCLVINVAGIFLCDCQSAWLAVMAAIFVLLFTCASKKTALLFSISALTALLVGVFTPGILPRLEYMPQTYTTRSNIWSTAIKGFLAHPIFGQGPLTYMFSYELYGGYGTYHAHSIYLDPLMSYGIAGTSLILSYLIVQFKALFSNRVKEATALVLSVACAALIHGITDNTLLWVQTGFLMMFVLSAATLKNSKKIAQIG